MRRSSAFTTFGATLLVALIAGACSAQPATAPSVTPLVVYVTPVPTPTPRPTPEPTTDTRPAWFEIGCEVAQSLRQAFDAWVEAVDGSDQGDADDVLNWVSYANDAMVDAEDAISSLPDWEDARSFVSAATSLYDALEQDLARIEDEPLGTISSDEFAGILQLNSDLFFAADDVPGSGSPGCDLQMVVH